MTGCCRGLSAKACFARPYGCSDEPPNFISKPRSTIKRPHGIMEASPTLEATMKPDLDKMIDAGIKAVDLYAIARDDVITRAQLRAFLKAALAVKRC